MRVDHYCWSMISGTFLCGCFKSGGSLWVWIITDEYDQWNIFWGVLDLVCCWGEPDRRQNPGRWIHCWCERVLFQPSRRTRKSEQGWGGQTQQGTQGKHRKATTARKSLLSVATFVNRKHAGQINMKTAPTPQPQKEIHGTPAYELCI